MEDTWSIREDIAEAWTVLARMLLVFTVFVSRFVVEREPGTKVPMNSAGRRLLMLDSSMACVLKEDMRKGSDSIQGLAELVSRRRLAVLKVDVATLRLVSEETNRELANSDTVEIVLFRVTRPLPKLDKIKLLTPRVVLTKLCVLT
jgi:hypothetical protein